MGSPLNRAVDVIVNRNARRLAERSPLRGAISAAAARAGARLHETRTLGELDATARAIAARGTDAVVLAGGDGSYMEGLSALARAFGDTLPAIGLAPGGTVSTIARSLGMRGRSQAWAERVLAAARDAASPVARHATLRVRDDAPSERVGFIAGAGLVANFFDLYYGAPRQGLAAAAAIAARVFAGSFVASPYARQVLDPSPCALAVDGNEHPARAWSLVLASVVRDVGLHLRVTYRAGEALDRFHVVASGLPPRALGPQMPRVLAGRPLQGEPRVDALARSLRVTFPPPRGVYVLDGDVMRAGQVRIEPGPVIRLLLG
jgi:diacylglycerol kinase family enzyme